MRPAATVMVTQHHLHESTDSEGGRVSILRSGVASHESSAEGRVCCLALPAHAHQRTDARKHTAHAPLHRRTDAHKHAIQGADYCTRGRVEEEEEERGLARLPVPEQEGQEGHGPRRREPCPVRQSDLAELRGELGQRSWRSAYRTLIGGDQPRLGAGDTEGAAAMVRHVEDAIARGGWSAPERNRLYRMRAAWGMRARGEDARFMLVGNRPGRLRGPAAERWHVLRQTIEGGARA